MNRKTIHIVAAIATAVLLSVANRSAIAGGALAVQFDPTNFSNGTVIDNPYWPLLPSGVSTRTFRYIGDTDDECVIDVVSTTTGDIKILAGDENADYAGFMAQVVLDTEWEVDDCDDIPTDDDLAELTYDWYAQDDFGNIWYLGEESRDFGDECPTTNEVPLGTDDWADYGYGDVQEDCTEGSWEAGQFGPEEEIVGEAGIVVPSDYPTGDEELTTGTYYMQEVAEGAEDMAKILKRNASVSIEDGDFAGDHENCRKVKEWTALEHGASVEHKYYCPGVNGPGLVLIKGIGGGPTESEVLVEMTSN